MRKMTTVVLAGLATGVLGMGGAVAAYAALGGAQGPGVRAAAVVNANGSVVRSKGVTGVRKLSTGQYCIELDSDYDAARSVPVATKRWGAPWGSTVFVDADTTACGSADRHVFVAGGNNGANADLPFHVIVP
ncbi:hypothetical protein ACIBIZ_45240 [Nonomuraea spiralis]|uniref:hypothetical protein n=1 Tax=Nonomuraea TaxID=83681 RepID=UPI000F796E06|nr:hypothetical protein [Nonomuraea sp. WAC 01424]RSN08384.1 hypothetical protein DMB42_20305 [Nonomuraea sp. WAC 01424]